MSCAASSGSAVTGCHLESTCCFYLILVFEKSMFAFPAMGHALMRVNDAGVLSNMDVLVLGGAHKLEYTTTLGMWTNSSETRASQRLDTKTPWCKLVVDTSARHCSPRMNRHTFVYPSSGGLLSKKWVTIYCQIIFMIQPCSVHSRSHYPFLHMIAIHDIQGLICA